MKSNYIMALTFSLLIMGFCTNAQDMGSKVYLPTGESLSQRETPQWYNDAKLGIFIHWGLYSGHGQRQQLPRIKQAIGKLFIKAILMLNGTLILIKITQAK